MGLNPYLPNEPKKREYAKLKPKWVPKSKKVDKQEVAALKASVSSCKLDFKVWGYSAKLDEVTTVSGYVKGLTAASAAFSAGTEASKLNEGAEVQRLEVWLEDAETEVSAS